MSGACGRLAVDGTRSARPADIPELLAIENAVFPGNRLERRHFRHAIGSPSIAIEVATRNGHVAGYVLTEFRRRARSARISSLAVGDDYGSQGIGRHLLALAEAEAQRRGCDRIRLEVRADNPRAADLYRRSGYREAGRIADFYEDGEAAETFEKAL